MKKSNCYQKLEAFFQKKLSAGPRSLDSNGNPKDKMIVMAEYLHYIPENIAILQADVDDPTPIINAYPDTYRNMESCKENRDKRSPLQYGQDLVASWVFEDYLLTFLQKNGIQVTLNGTDRVRRILPHGKVSAVSDYLLTYNNRKAFIELANDYTGYWARNNRCDLRDDKWKHICSLAKPEYPSWLLGVDFVNHKFFLKNSADNQDVTYIPSHEPFGGKAASSIALSNDELIDFTFTNFLLAVQEKLLG